MTTTNEIRIWADGLDKFMKRFGRLTRKANKLGVDEPTFCIVASESIPIRKPSRQEPLAQIPHRDQLTITVSGAESVRVDGFQFLARVEPSQDEGWNFIFRVPGVDSDLSKYRSASLRCDHCKTKRQRKNMYVIRDLESEQDFAVGRSCLQDFMRTPNASDLAGYAADIISFSEDDHSGSGGGEHSYNLQYLVSLTAAVIEVYGWKSAGSAWDEGGTTQPTRDVVLDAIHRTGIFKSSGRYLAEDVPQITPDHEQEARDAIEWGRSLSPDPTINTSDYLLNLTLALVTPMTPATKVGIVVSVIGAYRRSLANDERLDRIEREAAEAQPIPEAEGRMQIQGEVVAAKWKSGDYGDTLKIIVKHVDGWKLWGSVPSGLGTTNESRLIGSTVRFHARVERSKDDSTFGFYSRPTKAEFVN